jgi:hypothetical protein
LSASGWVELVLQAPSNSTMFDTSIL